MSPDPTYLIGDGTTRTLLDRVRTQLLRSLPPAELYAGDDSPPVAALPPLALSTLATAVRDYYEAERACRGSRPQVIEMVDTPPAIPRPTTPPPAACPDWVGR